MKNNFFQNNIISAEQFTREDLEILFSRTKDIEKECSQKKINKLLENKIMAALFYEPSSRTFSSFLCAMQKLGGGIIPLNGMDATSVAKGESLTDTVRVFSHFADVLVLRHPQAGSISLAAKYAHKPIINAGDGVNEHPTQAFSDLYTIKKIFGKIDGLHILIIGDLAHYRPTNSLVKLLSNFKNIRLSLASPSQVPIQENIRNYLREKNVNFTEYADFKKILPQIDILYVTRVKKEYMTDQLYQEVKGSYIVDKATIEKMKKESIVMHCLPRIDEISTQVDSDVRSVYLGQQVKNGLYLRMALLDLVLNNKS